MKIDDNSIMSNGKRLLSRHCVGTLVVKNRKALVDVRKCSAEISRILGNHDVEELGLFYHEFYNGSFTLVVALAESHISLHTWPERFAVQLDVFLCNYMNNNTEKCQSIFDAICDYFEPKESSIEILERL